MNRNFIFLFVSLLFLAGCNRYSENHQAVLPSPGFDVHVYFNLFNGNPYYMVYYEGRKIIKWSLIGFSNGAGTPVKDKMMLARDIGEAGSATGNPGETDSLFNKLKFNIRKIRLVSALDREAGYTIELRAFEGGLAFRYCFDSQEDKSAFVAHEATQIKFDDAENSWQVNARADSLGASADQFSVPVEVVSDDQLSVMISEANGYGSQMVMLPSEENPFHFSIRDEKIGTDQENGLVTPWRVILISNNVSHD